MIEPRCQNPHCKRPLVQAPGGHRKRQYCDGACRQMAHRYRVEQAERERLQAEMRARWTGLLPATQQALEDVLQSHGPTLASRVAIAVRSEISHAKDIAARLASEQCETRQVDQNIAAYQEKLTQAARRIEKLERQVAVQRERLGQYYQASFRVTELEQELARYREVLDLSDRVKLQVELLALGTALNYRRLLIVPISIELGVDGWLRYAEGEPNEALAKAILVARHFYTNLKELGMLS